MVIQSARDAAFGARLFYSGIMVFVVAIFLWYDCNLQKSLLSVNLTYFLGFFGLYGLSLYLFYTCGDNPGFVATNSSTTELTSVKTDSLEGNETLLQSNGNSNSINIDIEAGNNSQESDENNSSIRPAEYSARPSTHNGQDDGMRYCDICRIYQPYRSKHCKQCERCVYKFDHHCFWIGGCVGELNHRKFWLFLFFQTILELWAYLIADSGLDASYLAGQQMIKNGQKGISSPYQTTEYGAFSFASGCCILAFLFTGILLGFHTLLIWTNQSTWEFSKKDQLSYLKRYPRGYNPFNTGLTGNLKMIFCHGNQPTDWELPPVQTERRKRGFNWCENEYWSCC